jgi:hypothetical protein
MDYWAVGWGFAPSHLSAVGQGAYGGQSPLCRRPGVLQGFTPVGDRVPHKIEMFL